MKKISVYGARVNNLKNIDVEIPRDSLTVITGLSGSGKSSLAFDTIYAEGQRRYIETFSPYARNFLGDIERPDVDKITGLSPVISIEQKTTNRNPRSTVGTVTEIYDFLRLLYARAGVAYSYATGEKMVRYTEESVVEMISGEYAGEAIIVLAPVVRNRKGHYRELFDSLRRKGYLHVRVDGQVQELRQGMKTDRYKYHNIEVVIDKLKIKKERSQTDDDRMSKSIATAMKVGDGLIMIGKIKTPAPGAAHPAEQDYQPSTVKYFSKRLMCPTTGIAYRDPAPNNFSFNSPQGACTRCKGIGMVSEIDLDKVIPNRRISIHDGAIVPLGKYRNQMIFWQTEGILRKYGCGLKTPVTDIPEEAMAELLYGSMTKVRIDKELVHTSTDFFTDFNGIIAHLRKTMEMEEVAGTNCKTTEQFLSDHVCPECKGRRLNREALSYKIWDKDISQVADMDIADLATWIEQVELHMDNRQTAIAEEILKEIRTRIKFLKEVGLDYLSLSRPSASLSGGESQRIRLATQIGSRLVNVTYILDEPSIGLHQRDNELLIRSLKGLRDIGNTVIVVEHDKDMMLASDHIIDIGPMAGRHGGEVVYQGAVKDMPADTLTGHFLAMDDSITRKKYTPRKGNGKSLIIRGAKGNNLKNITAEFPLGKLIVVTGVSGSGKSTLVTETLLPILSQHFYRSLKEPLPYDSIEGLEYVDKVVHVDQSPLGRTPRSIPATYTGVFSDIRSLFIALPEAKIRGYKPGRFSFNVKGGRCETCSGNGYRTIEMNFLPDVSVPCEVCHGKRYNRETLEVRCKGKSIADVLDMTVNQAVEFFAAVPDISRKIKTLQDVGLGYIKLGQPSTTLSGGESQRVKLSTELSKRDTGKTVYILDEPTTGLHFEDIRVLNNVLARLVDKGNTVIIIEHNLDIIRAADHIIDMGPEGGREGGEILSTGTPDEVSKSPLGYTPKYL